MIGIIINYNMATDEAIIQEYLEDLHKNVKFYDNYMIMYNIKTSYTLIKYNAICAISFKQFGFCINYGNGISNYYNDILYRRINVGHKFSDELHDKIRDETIKILNKYINDNLFDKRFEEINKKIDNINEKLEAIILSPDSIIHNVITNQNKK